MTTIEQCKTEEMEVEIVIEAMRICYGYDFSNYVRQSLRRRLHDLRVQWELASISELIPQFVHDPKKAQAVINGISVPKSEFFRDPQVWQYLRENVLPSLTSYSRLNVWQAGCAKGEETYTILALLKDAGLLKRANVIATDINDEAIHTAQKATWQASYMPQLERNYELTGISSPISNFFDEDKDNSFSVKPELMANLKFFQHNLAIDESFMESNLIICRNVLIYFNAILQKRVLNLFSRSLARGGYLVLGRAECIMAPDELDVPLVTVSEEHRIFMRPVRQGVSNV